MLVQWSEVIAKCWFFIMTFTISNTWDTTTCSLLVTVWRSRSLQFLTPLNKACDTTIKLNKLVSLAVFDLRTVKNMVSCRCRHTGLHISYCPIAQTEFSLCQQQHKKRKSILYLPRNVGCSQTDIGMHSVTHHFINLYKCPLLLPTDRKSVRLVDVTLVTAFFASSFW